MLKEFLQELRSQAQMTLAPQLVQFDPHADLAFRQADGSLDFHLKRCDRNHALESLVDLCHFSSRFDGADNASIWYDADGVTFTLDDETAEDKAVLSLPHSPQWLAIVALAAGKAMSQRDLIQLLRTTFRDCLGKAGNLIENLRQIRWKSAADGESSVQRGKSSIGKTIQQQIEGRRCLLRRSRRARPVRRRHDSPFANRRRSSGDRSATPSSRNGQSSASKRADRVRAASVRSADS